MAIAEDWRKAHRKAVRWTGRRIIKSVAGFMAGQSEVGDAPVFDSALFPFISPLEDRWRLIRAELDEILKDRKRIPAFHQVAPSQYRISQGDSWKTFFLYGLGARHEANCARCPETARLLQGVPNLQTAWFSILAPGYHIPAHRGVTKGVLRCHLGLIVPEGDSCRMQVGDRTVLWREGQCVVFDDFYRHEVWNDTDRERVVLIFDFDRPMRHAGRALNKAILWGVKRTSFYKDAQRGMAQWDERLAAALDDDRPDTTPT
jgi:ornithine lipid ester-linked acyl 2-hydroxylase